jgi:hypothetical protein
MNFYEFPIPPQINGFQLKAELGCDEVYIRGDKLIIGGGLTEAQAKAGIAAHVPAPIAVPTIAEKLAKLGIDDVELRKHLGLETPVLKKQLGLAP